MLTLRVAGAFLGVCAALLWTGAGFIQFAYPEEQDKAKVRRAPNSFQRLRAKLKIVYHLPMVAFCSRRHHWVSRCFQREYPQD